MNFNNMEEKLKERTHNGDIYVRFYDGSSKGGEGSWSEELPIQSYYFDEQGDLILNIIE